MRVHKIEYKIASLPVLTGVCAVEISVYGAADGNSTLQTKPNLVRPRNVMKSTLTPERISHIVDGIYKQSVNRRPPLLILCGGEPMLYQDSIEKLLLTNIGRSFDTIAISTTGLVPLSSRLASALKRWQGMSGNVLYWSNEFVVDEVLTQTYNDTLSAQNESGGFSTVTFDIRKNSELKRVSNLAKALSIGNREVFLRSANGTSIYECALHNGYNIT